MLRLFYILLICFIAVPAMAQQSLSPEQVESIPFDNSLVGTPNTQQLSEDITSQNDAHGEKKAGLPQFDVTTFSSQLFWLAISFSFLYFFFSRYALPSISSTIEERRLMIANDLKEADKISSKVDKTRADYEQAMQTSYNDARLTITNTEQHMRDQAEIQAKQFKDKSTAAIADLEKQAEEAKIKIKADLKATAQNLTSDIISKLSDLDVTDTEITKAVDEFMETSVKPNNKKAA